MISLCLKTHNVTGLRYLCKTVKDPYNYSGSGVHWKNHLKKYGKDIHTEVLFECEDMEEFKEVAIKVSEELDIVDDPSFANHMIEQGQGGQNAGSFKKGRTAHNKGVPNPDASGGMKERHYLNRPVIKATATVKKNIKNWIRNTESVEKNNALQVECQYCGTITNLGNHKRWHGDKCKIAH